MRQISKDASQAFWNGQKFRRSNTEVRMNVFTVEFYLHGNLIAERSLLSCDTLRINHCGWPTVTTKERLNAILNVGGYRDRIYQKDYSWYISKDLEKDVPMLRGWNEIRD